MHYPPAPWTLLGFGLQTLQWIDVDRVRPLIPDRLNIVQFLPGKTLGGLYLASYQAGSTLQYNELIVVSGVIYHPVKLGAWISHIYVDNPQSVAGGREIWGLPKELAEFEWRSPQTCPAVTVKQGDRLLCQVKSQWQFSGWQQALPVPTFGLRQAQLLWFLGQGSFQWHLTNTEIEIPADSPFAHLGLDSSWLSLALNPLKLFAHAPSIVQQDGD